MTDVKLIRELTVSVDVYREDLIRLLVNIKKRGANRYTSDYLEERLRLANDLHANLRDCHIKICAAYDTEELAATAYMQEGVYEVALQAFEAVEAHILEHLSRLEEASSPVNTSSDSAQGHSVSSSVRLPKIDLPTFSGDYTEWSTFHDTFKSIIHENVGLPGIQKFHYLKSCLVGEASTVLKALTISGDNYATAWNTLVSRYQNKRIITATLLNKLSQVPQISANSLSTLKTLRDTVTVTLDALRNLGYAVDSWGPLIVHTSGQHFDSTLRLEWERCLSDLTEYPSFNQLRDFISGKVNMLESLGLGTSTIKPSDKGLKSHTAGLNKSNCVYCGRDHWVHRCERFLRLQPSARLKQAQRMKLCVNCLRGNHTTPTCKNQNRCRICSKPHHSLLHLDLSSGSVSSSQSKTFPPSGSNTSEPSTSSISSNLSVTDSRTVLLATVVVRVETDQGHNLVARGLVDPGSETSFITENLAQQLHVKRNPVNASIFGVTGGVSHKVNSETTVRLCALSSNLGHMAITALILPRITTYVPSSCPSAAFPQLNPSSFADQCNGSSAPIDFLIGADYYPQLLTGQSLPSIDSNLMAQSTRFGWIVTGLMPSRPRNTHVNVLHCCDLERDLRKFWELEEVPSTSTLSDEDRLCEQKFTDSVQQQVDGHFVVSLPFRSEEAKNLLGDSRRITEASLTRFVSRVNRNPKLKKEYDHFMFEYEELGHMSSIPFNVSHSDQRVYFPHHAVVKQENGRDKIRVVFNASSKTRSGYSLNDVLLVGPKLQQDITVILLNWRGHHYAGVTDIVKMFRQILIHPRDRRFQNILLEGSPTSRAFQLNTVTYGTGPAPYLAMRVLKELAFRHGNDFPLAKHVVLNSIYVDDLLFGADNFQEFTSVQEQLINLLKKGGFELSKWATTVPIPSSMEPRVDSIIFEEPDEVPHKILGITWNPVRDTFHFQIQTTEINSLTKRILLSENSKIFDPMGWISPVTIALKQLMQSTWLLKLSWDDEIPDPLRSRWLDIYGKLTELRELAIPRWDNYESGCMLDLVGFCDASSVSYGAVVYARVTTSKGVVSTNLVMAKTKVAPVKTISIPRMELVAAALLTRLVMHLRDHFQRPINSISCYSDSQIVLAWIAQHPSNWKVFVANRVSFIQTGLPEARWSYVNTKLNPADLNSRGISPSELLTSRLWWEGPGFLKEGLPTTTIQAHTEEERRKSALATHHASLETWEPIVRFSSWSKTVRVFAYVGRFIAKCRKRDISRDTFLTQSEIFDAKVAIFRSVQFSSFPQELASLAANRNLSSRSNLLPLAPFLDSDGLLKVGGRLRNSFLSECEKHPVILPSGHISALLIRSIHHRTLHGGVQLTLTMLRKEVWILNARRTVKAIIHRCVVCTREKAQLGSQFMGSLPKARITPSNAFAHTGVDYAGPFLMHIGQGRGGKTCKSYISVFVCLATRAIHLELVTRYDTDAFLAAFSRFVARRGRPTTMYSDNGLNFQGANAELRRAFKTAVHESATKNNDSISEIDWKFIPVASPHWGGLWESGVRAVKYHFKRIMGSFIPTYEEFSTILCKIEACLNSRPLTRIHDDPESLEVLTPGHFLTGRALLAPPERSVLDIKETTLNRWQKVVRITEAFWRKWSSEYLNSLQSRSKWRTKTNIFQEGDLVLIKHPINPPSQWNIGRITKLIPGVDSVSRVASVRTKNKEIQRSFTQLCKLPVTNASQ